MTLITSPVPQVGQTNASEQIDTTNLLTEIKSLLNGGVSADNLTTAFGALVDPPVVSALPGSPVTGQRVRVRAGAAPGPPATSGVLWSLRYNADAAEAFKWEADGQGSPLFSTLSGGGIGGTTSTLTVPFSGLYDVSAFAETNQGNADGEIGLVVSSGGEVGRARRFTPGARLQFGPTRLQLTAGAQTLIFSSTAGGTFYTGGFFISPVRVS